MSRCLLASLNCFRWVCVGSVWTQDLSISKILASALVLVLKLSSAELCNLAATPLPALSNLPLSTSPASSSIAFS